MKPNQDQPQDDRLHSQALKKIGWSIDPSWHHQRNVPVVAGTLVVAGNVVVSTAEVETTEKI